MPFTCVQRMWLKRHNFVWAAIRPITPCIDADGNYLSDDEDFFFRSFGGRLICPECKCEPTMLVHVVGDRGDGTGLPRHKCLHCWKWSRPLWTSLFHSPTIALQSGTLHWGTHCNKHRLSSESFNAVFDSSTPNPRPYGSGYIFCRLYNTSHMYYIYIYIYIYLNFLLEQNVIWLHVLPK